MSPRSAYFYEFPPGGNTPLLILFPVYNFFISIDNQASTSKKKTTFSRLLRTLRPHRKDKHNNSVSPTNNRQQPRSILPPCAAATSGTPVTVSSRVSTPDEPVPPDYDHVRLLQMNPRGQPVCGVVSPGGFEETIQRVQIEFFVLFLFIVCSLLVLIQITLMTIVKAIDLKVVT